MATDTDAGPGNFNSFNTLRRSLRQINPFKNKFFRLPATPRLSRSRKVIGHGEETTGWNFERPSVSVTPGYPAKRESNGFQHADAGSAGGSSGPHIFDFRASNTPSSSNDAEFDLRRDMDNMSLIYGFPPDAVSQPGGSCRLNNRHSRPPLPTFNPPNAREAETIIHEHMRNLMASPLHASRQQFLFLPNNSYAPSGEIYDARWQAERRRNNESPISSPTQSTISLINTQNRINSRSISTGGSMRQDRSSLRPSYQLNGLFHHPSLKSLTASIAPETANGNTVLPSANMKVAPLFTLTDVIVDGEAENAFLGREWVFKELYQMVIVEHAPFTLVQGSNGSGKTAIARQLILQSPFFTSKAVNGDTVDSGIVIGSQVSLNSTLSSRNYEWLRAIAVRIVAYHNCRLYSAATCTIPDFVQNIASQMFLSPLLHSYADQLRENTEVLELLSAGGPRFAFEPVDLFRKVIVEPLKRVIVSEDECMVVVIDGIDEADFHRNEHGESIAWLLQKTASELPSWLRFVLTSASFPPLCGLDVRTVHLDDAEMDQRVHRDGRLLVDYRITISPTLEQRMRACSASESISEVVDDLVFRSRGNQLYLLLLLDLVEQNKIDINPKLLPMDLKQLYLLYFNLNFKSLAQFYVVAPLISVIVSSLRPLSFGDLFTILNSVFPEPSVSEEELLQRLELLSPLILKLANGTYVPIHSTFRDWVLKISDQTDYVVEVREGHILHSLSLVRRGNLNPDQLFELGHHLLKANPFKYMRAGIAEDMPSGKDCHIAWIQKAASANALCKALLCERNSYYSNSKVSRLLLLSGADPNAIWPDGTSLLGVFCRAGNLTMSKLLVQFDADVNYKNLKTGITPMLLAIQKGHLETVRMLYEAGAQVEIHDNPSLDCLVQAAISNSVAVMSYLIECEWTFNDRRDKRSGRYVALKTAFEAAAKHGRVKVCEFLLDCTDAITDASTAMCVACASGQSETVQFLLSRGATLSTTQYWQGKSALICAIESGSWDLVINVLNSSKIDVNEDRTNDEGWTPLIVAARHGHVGLVDLLLNRDANMDLRDAKGRTAIMHTIICRHASTAALLIDRGCDLALKDNQGNGLIHLLAQYFNKCLTDRLLEMGLSLEEKNNEDLRPIEIAIRHCSQSAVDIFLRRGARLRTLTWRMAVESDPHLILVLIRKLLDDAAILFRRKRVTEAVHRFDYALEKCSELLGDNPDAKSALVSNNAARQRLATIQPQLRHYKVQIIIAISNFRRKNNQLTDAIIAATEGLQIADSDDTRFELHLIRAKCFFDGQNVAKARVDAEAAAALRPENVDVQNLLSVLNMPSVNE